MSYCCVAYLENGLKKQSTVPISWVRHGILHWPPSNAPKDQQSKWFHTGEAPKPDWSTFPGSTILFTGKCKKDFYEMLSF